MGLLIMKKYLAIIRKLDFVDLFKYGQFIINYAVPFDGELSDYADDDNLFDALTSKMNMYEYSFEYLIIQFIAKDNLNQDILIDVRNVRALYTFDEEAKREMSISFDPRIQLHVSPWTQKFEKLQQTLSIRQSTRGIDNLWTIFNLPEEDRSRCEKIIKPNDIEEVFRELYAYERPSGDLSIWIYLLRYERHSFYPKGMLGFFCDFIHVYCNYSKKLELNGEVAESTQLFPQLTACSNQQFAPLLQIVETSPLAQLTENASGCRFTIAAPLFLYLKSQFAEGMEHKPNDNLISYGKKVGGFECSVAVYLLGIALGYDKTYDAFYETADLSFFKKSTIAEYPSKINGGQKDTTSRFPEEDKIDDTANDSNSEDEISNIPTPEKKFRIAVEKTKGCVSNLQGKLVPQEFSNNTNNDLPLKWMKKKSKGQKADVRPVFDKEELEKLTQLGYEPVTRFDKTVKDAINLRGFDLKSEKKRLAKKKMNEIK